MLAIRKENRRSSVLDTEQRGRVNVNNEKGIKKQFSFRHGTERTY